MGGEGSRKKKANGEVMQGKNIFMENNQEA